MGGGGTGGVELSLSSGSEVLQDPLELPLKRLRSALRLSFRGLVTMALKRKEISADVRVVAEGHVSVDEYSPTFDYALEGPPPLRGPRSY